MAAATYSSTLASLDAEINEMQEMDASLDQFELSLIEKDQGDSTEGDGHTK